MKKESLSLVSLVGIAGLVGSTAMAGSLFQVQDVTPGHWTGERAATQGCGAGQCGAGQCGSGAEKKDAGDKEKKADPKAEKKGSEATCGAEKCGSAAEKEKDEKKPAEEKKDEKADKPE